MDTAPFRQLTEPARDLLVAAWALAGLAAATAFVPYVALWLVARELLGGDPGEAPRGPVLIAGVVAVAVAAVSALVLRLSAYGLSHRADLRVQRAVRERVAAHLSRVPLGRLSTGARTLEHLQGDVEELHAAVAHGRMEIVPAVVTPVLAGLWLLVVDWRLALLVGVPTVAVHLAQRRLLSGAGERQRAVTTALGTLVDTITELVRDLPTLRVVRRGDGAASLSAESDRFREAQRAAYVHENRRGVQLGVLVDAVTTTVLVVGVGGAMVAAGAMTPLDLVVFALVAATVAAPLQDVGTATTGMRAAHLAAGRLVALLDEPTLPEAAASRAAVPRDAAVHFAGVSFGHRPDEPVLHDVDLELAPGTVTALVGPSGAGKSTLAALAARFHDVDAGAVLVGGVDVRDVASAELYRHVGFLLQDSRLLRLSVRENIALARPDATEDAVVEAARAARVHDRILELPRGYDTVVGDETELSGGERQRVAIARLLLTDPSVLLLDEPTAHVDPETEAAVQEAIATLARGRTVLVVAHRLATVTGADRIVVLDRGRVVATGTHRELLDGDEGTYRRLWSAGARCEDRAGAGR